MLTSFLINKILNYTLNSKKISNKIKDGENLDSDEENFAIEYNL